MTPNRVRGIIIRANEPHRTKIGTSLAAAMHNLDSALAHADKLPNWLTKLRVRRARRQWDDMLSNRIEAPGGYRCKA